MSHFNQLRLFNLRLKNIQSIQLNAEPTGDGFGAEIRWHAKLWARQMPDKGLNDINLRWYKNGDAERRAFGESASTYILINPISRYFNVITFVVPITIIMVKRFNGSRQKAFCIRLTRRKKDNHR